MRFVCSILLLFVYSICFAGGHDEADLKKAVNQLNSALLQRDSTMLKKLLHNKVQYGHSNGWIETKREVIDDLYNGKLVYNKIESSPVEIVEEEHAACVRSTVDIDVLMNGKPIQLKLHVLQVWVKKKSGWALLSRQSTKV